MNESYKNSGNLFYFFLEDNQNTYKFNCSCIPIHRFLRSYDIRAPMPILRTWKITFLFIYAQSYANTPGLMLVSMCHFARKLCIICTVIAVRIAGHVVYETADMCVLSHSVITFNLNIFNIKMQDTALLLCDFSINFYPTLCRCAWFFSLLFLCPFALRLASSFPDLLGLTSISMAACHYLFGPHRKKPYGLALHSACDCMFVIIAAGNTYSYIPCACKIDWSP